jgi:hypothetical protein
VFISLPRIRSRFDLQLAAANWFFTLYFAPTGASISHCQYGWSFRQGNNKEITAANIEFTSKFLHCRPVSD